MKNYQEPEINTEDRSRKNGTFMTRDIVQCQSACLAGSLIISTTKEGRERGREGGERRERGEGRGRKGRREEGKEGASLELESS
jgi:hypothetical protein